MLTRIRPLLVPVGVIVLALTIFNLRVSREMGDFEVSRTAGRRAIAAQPLYQVGDAHNTFTYLPTFAVAMAPMAVLGHDAARVTWFALSCAFLVILLRWSAVILPARRWSVRTVIIVALVLLAKFYAHELMSGHPHLLLAVLLMAGLGALQIDSPKLAAVCVGLATFVSPLSLILLPWVVMSHGGIAGIVGGVTVLLGLLAPVVLYGWAGTLAQVADWWQIVSGASGQTTIGADSISMAAMWTQWIGAGPLAAALTVATVLLLLAVATAVWMQRRGLDEPDYLEFSLLLLLVPLLSPHAGDSMLVLATPAVMLVADRWRELPTPWRWWSGTALMLMGFGLFVPWSIVSVCAIVIAATLAQMRVRRLG